MRLILGNLLVVPIERSLVYVEPLYIAAEQGQLPELKRVLGGSVNGELMTGFSMMVCVIIAVSVGSS